MSCFTKLRRSEGCNNGHYYYDAHIYLSLGLLIQIQMNHIMESKKTKALLLLVGCEVGSSDREKELTASPTGSI